MVRLAHWYQECERERGLSRTHRELHFNTVTCFLTGLFECEDERVEILVGNLMVFCV
jgi:hypothetical protein